MDKNRLTQAGINVEEGIDRFGGKQELYEKFLYRFPDEPTFAQMCEAIERGSMREAFAAAHSLKGEAGNLSMNRLYGDICPLVEELRRGSLEKAKALLTLAVRDYDDVIAALSNRSR